jgi:hypothetical protein
MFLGNFSNREDVITDFKAPVDALEGAKILLAWYGPGDYCGDAFVLFRKDGKLFEAHGSHCSCYGLEGQWAPEETSKAALEKREFYSEYHEYKEAGAALKAIIENL